MEPAYFSAFAALAGSMVGGLTSLTASWLTQHVQFRAQQRALDLSRREQLYEHFNEGSPQQAAGYQNPKPSKQLHLDVLTMQLLIRLCTALLLDILAYDFFI